MPLPIPGRSGLPKAVDLKADSKSQLPRALGIVDCNLLVSFLLLFSSSTFTFFFCASECFSCGSQLSIDETSARESREVLDSFFVCGSSRHNTGSEELAK